MIYYHASEKISPPVFGPRSAPGGTGGFREKHLTLRMLSACIPAAAAGQTSPLSRGHPAAFPGPFPGEQGMGDLAPGSEPGVGRERRSVAGGERDERVLQNTFS